MKPKQNICLFGGTFDPIHLGHTYIAQKAKLTLELDKVIFLPCRQSPHKLGKQSAPDHDRLKMCQLATQDLLWAEVNDHDLIAETPSYSWKTAEYFKATHPNANLFWLMGTDQWNSLDRWARCEHLASLVTFIVFTRGDQPLKEHHFAPHFHTIQGNHPASATAVRKWIKEHSLVGVPHLDTQVKTFLSGTQNYKG